jgi:hypothetical protein
VITHNDPQQVVEPGRLALVLGSVVLGVVAGVLVAMLVGLLELVLVAVSP